MTKDTGQFVVLTHDHPFLHWDLMLEEDGSLRTWRLHAEPTSAAMIVAEPLPDHRLAYLDYEGPLSGGRGVVTRWDRGLYTQTERSSERIVCRVSGERLTGIIALTSGGDSENWRFRYQPTAGKSR